MRPPTTLSGPAWSSPPASRTSPGATPSPAALARERHLDALAIGLPCLLAAVLVGLGLGTRSLWVDEGATVAIASAHGSALWSAIAHDGGNMLGFYLLEHALIGAFGHGAALIRLPSALATVATVGLVGILGLRLLGRGAALAAGLIAAVSLPLVFWGQDARGYALMITFITASYLAFLVLLDSRPGTRGARWALVAYVLLTLLAAYMGFAAVLVVPAQLLTLVWRRERVRAAVAGAVVVAIGCVPLAVLAAERGSSQLFWVPPPNWHVVRQTATWLTSAGLPPNFHPTVTTTLLLVVTCVLVLAAAGWVVLAAARREAPARWWAGMLALLWLAVPLGLSLLESLAGQPILLFRNGVIVLPAVALLLALVLTAPAMPRVLAITLLLGLLGLRALQLAPSYGATPENWNAAARSVLVAARPGDCLAVYPLDSRMALGYYVGVATRWPRPVWPTDPWGTLRPHVEQYDAPGSARLRAIEAACPRLWLVSSHQGQPGGPAAARAHLARYRALVTALGGAYGSASTRSYGWAAPVRVTVFSR